MSYDEVIKLKKDHSEPFIVIDEDEYELFAMPAGQKDFDQYKKFVEENFSELIDEDAKMFSANNEYSLGAIFQDFRGIILIKRNV